MPPFSEWKIILKSNARKAARKSWQATCVGLLFKLRRPHRCVVCNSCFDVCHAPFLSSSGDQATQFICPCRFSGKRPTTFATPLRISAANAVASSCMPLTSLPSDSAFGDVFCIAVVDMAFHTRTLLHEQRSDILNRRISGSICKRHGVNMLYGTWSNKYENSLLELSEVMIVKLHGTRTVSSLCSSYEILSDEPDSKSQSEDRAAHRQMNDLRRMA